MPPNHNKRFKWTSTALLVLCFSATLAQNKQLRSGHLTEALSAMDRFAPEYTKREKVRLVLKGLIWAAPLYLICQFWFFDWLSEYSENANCYFYGSITGVHLVMYGLFFLMPFTFGVIFFHIIGKDAIQTIKLAQHPLPGKKVFQKTKYVYGNKEKLKGFIVLACVSAFFIISIWGITAANKITSDVKPCDKHLTRASNGLVKLSLFVQGTAQKPPVQLTAVAGVIGRKEFIYWLVVSIIGVPFF